jgi:hypothetical protein
MAYEPMIQGIVGASILARLQKLGYSLYFSSQDQVKVVVKDGKIKDEQDVETKINAYLKKNSVLPRALQAGSFYIQPSFQKYRESVTDKDGNIINSAGTDMKAYVEYLKKKPLNELTAQEKVFLSSSQHFDKGIHFQTLLTQSKDYTRVLNMMESITGDTELRTLLLGAQNNPNTTQKQTPPMVPA